MIWRIKHCVDFAEEFIDTVRIKKKKKSCGQIKNRDNFAMYVNYVQKKYVWRLGKDEAEMLSLQLAWALCPLEMRDGEKRIVPGKTVKDITNI